MSFGRPSLAAAILIGPLSLGCQDELPKPPSGLRIRGTVTYDGDEAREFGAIRLRVSAFPTWPPSGPPIAQQEVQRPHLTADDPFAYELKQLSTKSTYFVVAQLIDDTEPLEQLPLDVPLGAYPNTCALGSDAGRIAVVEDEPIEDIDIVIYDGAGSEDPCTPERCPDPGKASLDVEVESDAEDVTAADQLVVALFESWPPPPGPPAALQLVPGAQLSFPQQVLVKNVVPGDYAVYVCLDRNSDGLMGCTDEDTFSAYEAGSLASLDEDTVTSLSVALEDGTGEIVSVESCPPAEK